MGEREIRRSEGTRFSTIRWFDTIDSTNRYLLELARFEPVDGLVVVADHQAQGRGRRGRMWDSKPGASLLFSVLFRPEDGVNAFRYAQALGLAVVDAFALAGGFSASLKWPNDVVADGRKLAGILVESEQSGAAIAAVAGCGINLNWAGALPEPLRSSAVSADDLAGRPLDAEQVLREILAALEMRLVRPDWISDAYRARCTTLGSDVRVIQEHRELTGKAVDVDSDGALLVESDSGIERVTVGEVVHLRPA